MTLNTFFQISVSIFCVVATIFMLILFVWLIILKAQLDKLIKKLEDIAEIVQTATGDIKDFIERIIQSLEVFKKNIFTFEFARRIIMEIIGLIKNNNDSKGVTNGQSE